MASRTVIWYRDPAGAFSRDSAPRFVPLRTMNLTQQLNATFRLALYYSLAMTLLTRNVRHLTAAAVVAAITLGVHEYGPEHFGPASTPGGCTAPTSGNPYMNVTHSDLATNPRRPAACDPLSAANRRRAAALDAAPLTDGPYEKENSRWYTMPVTTVPNDQGGFAQALYGGTQNALPGRRA